MTSTWASRRKRLVWVAIAVVLVAAVCVTLTWVLRTHPSNSNPWLHLPAPKDPDTAVSAGDDCGSFRPRENKNSKVDVSETKVVVNRGSITCGEAVRAIDSAYRDARQTGVDFPVDDGWNCVGLTSVDAALAGYKLKCQKDGTEIRLVPVMDRNANNVVDSRIYRLPPGAPETSGEAYSFSPPNRNVWCQINLDASGAVKDVVCQGELPPNAPLVNGRKPNSVVLDADPGKQGGHFVALDIRIVDFVPPLPMGGTIQVLAIECTASAPDELTCTANKGTSYEHGFTISSRGYEFR